MGERAIIVALTAVLLIILVLLYILYMRTTRNGTFVALRGAQWPCRALEEAGWWEREVRQKAVPFWYRLFFHRTTSAAGAHGHRLMSNLPNFRG